MRAKFNQSTVKLAIISTMTLAFAVLGILSYAGTATDNMIVTAEVLDSCAMTVNPIAFGSYDGAATHAAVPLTATGTLVSTCTSGAAATFAMRQGMAPNVASTDALPKREMVNGEERLAYDIYQDDARSIVWGNTSDTQVAVTGTGASQTRIVYGSMAAGQIVAPGSYVDSILVTVTY